MNKKNSTLIVRTILCIIVFVIFNVQALPEICGNYGECTVEPGCEGGGDSSTGLYIPESNWMLKMYIVDGAGYVLNTYSGMGTLLRQIEMSELYGPDYCKMRETLYGMIEDMERARHTYYIVNGIMQMTPYKKSVIDGLKIFDYDGLREKAGLMPVVFDHVKGYLERGDVRGVFTAIHKNTGVILDQLYILKETLEADKLPAITSAWKLNQTFTESVLFGQYFSQVMYQILFVR